MKLPFLQFYPTDWLRDTRRLSAQTKAVWIDIIAYCWNEPERGVYTRTKRAMCHEHYLDEAELDEVLFELKTVADVLDGPEEVTIMSRRIRKIELMRDYERKKKARQRCPGDVPAHVPKESRNVPPKTLEVRRQTLEKDNVNILAAAPAATLPPKRVKKQRAAIEFWQQLVDHINAGWMKKKGAAYPWDDHEFKKLRTLASTYQASGVMALWDLYIQMGTYFGKLTGYMLDGLRKDIGVIVDQSQWKTLSQNYEKKLYDAAYGPAKDVKEFVDEFVGSAKSVPK